MAVTYSGRTPFLEAVDKLNLSSLGLALRALFRYTTNLIASFHFHCGYFIANTPSLLFSYFISDTMEFKEFVEAMHPVINNLYLTTAIKCIMEHSDKGVLLLVDEIMKSGQGDTALVHFKVFAIAVCLDALTTRFNTVMTTRNMVAMRKESSGRIIEWITLAPPSLDEATSLFGADAAHSPILRQCIADCNGHYRSLEALKLVWDKYKHRRTSYSGMIRALGKTMHARYNKLSIPLIKAALRGFFVDLDATPDGKFTHAQYLEAGTYLNTPGSRSRFVPKISPVQLLLWAETNADSALKVHPLLCLFIVCLFLYSLKLSAPKYY